MGWSSRNRSRKKLAELAAKRGWKTEQEEGKIVVRAERIERFSLYTSSDSNNFTLTKDGYVERASGIDYDIRKVRVENSNASLLELFTGKWIEPPPEGMSVFETGVAGFDRFFRTRHATPDAAKNLLSAAAALAETAPLLDGFKKVVFDISLSPDGVTCIFRKGQGRPSALPVDDFGEMLADYVRFCEVFTTAVRGDAP